LHQKETAEFLTLHPRACVFNEMGTSKTASALWATDYLMQCNKVQKALIIAPLSTLEPVWQRELFDVLMHRTHVVLRGSRDTRLRLLDGDFDVYIINIDAIDIIHKAVMARPDINLIIADEAHKFRNGQTKRYETFSAMVQPADRRVWLMTGTPFPNAPTDAWALAHLMKSPTIPKWFGEWRRRTMFQINATRWLPKPGSFELAYNAVQPAIRFKKSECLDLPPMLVENAACQLSEAQISAYRTMLKSFVAETDVGAISAVNAADRLNKLRQILCGVVKNTDTGEYVILDHKPRVAVLKDAIESASSKVLVIVPYKGIIRALEQDLYKDYSCAILNGDVPPKERVEILNRFKHEPDPHVLLCHPKVMAHGLTLTEADTIIFYAPIYSSDEAQQVVDRINRPGQTRKMTVVRMAATTLEWDIYKILDNKKEYQESILDLYKKALTADI
jgi:SNF2 family DNA or RNA helicase